MRSVWKGSVSFGLVNIPVAVYPLHVRKKDQSPIRYKKVAEVDDEEVPADQIIKGYEYEKGKWAMLEDKDFEAVEIESTHSIEITGFIRAVEVNPKYFYKPYFQEAMKGGEKSYALMHRALVETGKVGIAKVAIRSREYLAAIKPDGLFIMLELMHFAHEVLEPEGLKTAVGAELAPKEIQMAKALIESLSGEFLPEQYVARYQDALREMIDRKVKHLPAGKTALPRPTAPAIDLMAILQQSIQQNVDKRKKPGLPRRGTAALVKRKRAGASILTPQTSAKA